MDCGSIGLLSLNTLDVDDVLLPVDLHHFANLLAFVVSTDNLFVNKTSEASQNNTTYTFKCQIMSLSAMSTIIPELRRLCGWAWTSHCTSGGAPWTEGKTWSSSWCVRGHWSASCGSCGGRRLQMDSASWCYKSQQNIQVINQVTTLHSQVRWAGVTWQIFFVAITYNIKVYSIKLVGSQLTCSR